MTLEHVLGAAPEVGADEVLEAVDTLAGMGQRAQPAVAVLERLARRALRQREARQAPPR